MTSPPDRPVWPAGITVRTMRPDQDERLVHATIEEAFADHWGHCRARLRTGSRRCCKAMALIPR